MSDRKKDALDKAIERVQYEMSDEGKEAARLAKMARELPPHRKADMSGDRTGTRQQSKRKEEVKEYRNGGKVSLGNFKGNF